jgi:hypothetical protein
MGANINETQTTDSDISEESGNTGVVEEKNFMQQPLLSALSEDDDSAEMKTFLINYTGYKIKPDDGKVNVNMIAELLAAEFPEFAYSFAEENFIRGYQAGLEDASKLHTRATEKAAEE